MAPTRSSVASVTQNVRNNHPNHRGGGTAPSVSVAANNVSTSTHSLRDAVDHSQFTLSEVPSLEPPSAKPPVAALLRTPRPGQGRLHVVAGVAHVPVRVNEAAAIENIQQMRAFARGMLSKWPLNGLFGWLDGGKETGLDEPAPDTTVPRAEPKATFPDTPPPPYSLKEPLLKEAQPT